MLESPEELAQLQELMDASMAAAGPHISSIITAERRLTAAQLCEQLTGMRLLSVATVTADGRPLAGRSTGTCCTARSGSARAATPCACATWPPGQPSAPPTSRASTSR